jgi:hypothetical protein
MQCHWSNKCDSIDWMVCLPVHVLSKIVSLVSPALNSLTLVDCHCQTPSYHLLQFSCKLQVFITLTLCHILHSVSHWPVLVYFIKLQHDVFRQQSTHVCVSCSGVKHPDQRASELVSGCRSDLTTAYEVARSLAQPRGLRGEGGGHGCLGLGKALPGACKVLSLSFLGTSSKSTNGMH